MGLTLIKLSLMVLFVILLWCNDNVVEGARDVELESELNILNKTPIKIIRTEAGDVFDCIDINNQPSLDHPLLKNHVIKSRPISSDLINTMVKDNNHETLLRKLDCPDGTVPIRRTFKEDLIRAKSFSKSSQLLHSSVNIVGDQLDDALELPVQGQFLSIVKTRKDSGIEYVGIEAGINVYNPPVVENQVSTAQLWIENGPKGELNSLQAGWMVAPSLFGDNRTRIFGKWQIDGRPESEGCYNILCPGFIQVNKDHTLGIPISPVSQFGGIQYEIKIGISQDEYKNWWVSVSDRKIGYWPAELGFSHLTSGSSVIAWGGLAQGKVATSVPPTGNGHHPRKLGDFRYQCSMTLMKVTPTKTLHWEDPTKEIMDTFATKKECSDIIYYGRINRRDYQHTIAFGGPGGNCQF